MDITPALWQKYYRGECTDQERKAIEAWLAETSPKTGFPFPAHNDGEHEARLLRDAIRRHVRESRTRTFFPAKQRKRWISSAASIAVAVSLGYFATRQLSRPSHADLRIKKYQLPFGQKGRLTLPDGTVAFLNAGSSIAYPTAFSEATRQVLVEGEGYFKVAKNAAKPFVVNAKNTVTKVRGTRFNLRAYPDKRYSTVTVEEGQVCFGRQNDNHGLLLDSGDIGIVNPADIRKKHSGKKPVADWVHKTFRADHEKMHMLARKIERWYGVNVQIVPRSLLDLTVSTNLPHNPSLLAVLDDLSAHTGIHYLVHDKNITLF